MVKIAPQIYRALADALSTVYAPGCSLNCWQWAQANISLTPEESRDFHGPYDTTMTLYVRRVMEFVTTPALREKEMIIRKSAQLGFTLAYLIIICYLAAVRQTHVLFAMDSAKEAKNISLRIRRLLTTNPSLAGTLTAEGEEDLQNLFLRLRGMDVFLAGSGAAGAFANKSVGLVILDELDKHVPSPGGHANTIDLARERIKKVQEGKLMGGGTPQAWEGETNQNFMTGTREELYVPCPHCAKMQPIRWERIKFDHCKDEAGEWQTARILAETFLQCEACAKPIREADKPKIFPQGKWIPQNTGADDYKPFPGRCSIWINDLYSQDPQTSWGRLALRFIDAQKSPSKLLNFFNDALGLPKKESRTEINKADLYKLAGGYEHGCMPVMPAMNPVSGLAAIVVCSDVQATEKKWVKCGFTHSGECYLIDYGRCLTLQELNAVASEPVWIGLTSPAAADVEAVRTEAVSAGRDFYSLLRERLPGNPFQTASTGFIDEGHDTFVIRDFCQSTADFSVGRPPFFFPSKGVSHITARELVAEIPDKFQTTNKEYITVYHYNDDGMKRELYLGRIGEFEAIRKGKSAIPRFWLPTYVDAEFVAELCQEKRAQMMHRGKITWMWLDPKGANDWGDAVKMSLALWHVIRPSFPATTAAEALPAETTPVPA